MKSDEYYGGYIDPNRPNPMGPNDAHIIIYGYIPSQALSILGIALFVFLLLVHILQIYRYRVWSFIPLAVATVMEIIGYSFRYRSYHDDPYNKIYFIVQYFFIVVAPVLLSASIYVCLTKLIRQTRSDVDAPGERSRLRPKPILWFFISADTVTTIIQVSGASLIGTKTSKHQDPTTANNILLAGLAVQTFCFVVFLVLFAYLLSTNAISRIFASANGYYKGRPFIAALGVSSVLVFLRTIFRLAETSQGVFGYLSSHEAFFGSLEFAPIVLAVGILAVWHPGRWPIGTQQVKRESQSANMG